MKQLLWNSRMVQWYMEQSLVRFFLLAFPLEALTNFRLELTTPCLRHSLPSLLPHSNSGWNSSQQA